MCGRYALALRPSQIVQRFQDYHIPVDDAPDDEGEEAPRQSYNFAPGYHGLVYRADVGERGAGHDSQERQQPQHQNPQDEDFAAEDGANDAVEEVEEAGEEADANTNDNDNHHGDGTIGSRDASRPQQQRPRPRPRRQQQQQQRRQRYKLQSMKWGLIPFWTKRNPDYAVVLKTINCRDDSLAQPGGMWNTMKRNKRCIVVVEGFYEWLKKGPGGKERVPHYVKRKDGKLMLLAGLWDCVSHEEDSAGNGGSEKIWTYTIITTSSNDQLKFLHDRMPVILDPGSEEMKIWLDPERKEWTKELQGILKPYDKGELEVYAVSKEVGKVGNNSATFVIPVASRENKANIANWFQPRKQKKGEEEEEEAQVVAKKEEAEDHKSKVKDEEDAEVVVKKEGEDKEEEKTLEELVKKADDGGMKAETPKKGIKREAESPSLGDVPSAKKTMTGFKSADTSPLKSRPKISATKNPVRSPAKKVKAKAPDGSQKITKFFGNSA